MFERNARGVSRQSRGSLRPAPYQRSRGTSEARHSAIHTSRGSAPAAIASSALTCPNSARTRSRVSATPKPSPNSAATARRNSLSLTKRRSAHHEVSVEVRHELRRHRVGNHINPLQNRDTVAHLAHDHRDGGVQSLRDRSENLTARLLLPTLHLTEVAEGHRRATRDLPKSSTLLQAEVTKHVTDFLTNQNHVNPPPQTLRVVTDWLGSLPASGSSL